MIKFWYQFVTKYETLLLIIIFNYLSYIIYNKINFTTFTKSLHIYKESNEELYKFQDYIPGTDKTTKLYAQHLMKTNSLIKEAAASSSASTESSGMKHVVRQEAASQNIIADVTFESSIWNEVIELCQHQKMALFYFEH